jgi:hypothetical protein
MRSFLKRDATSDSKMMSQLPLAPIPAILSAYGPDKECTSNLAFQVLESLDIGIERIVPIDDP